ncbi:Gfo/Idh/MocA family protein [Streptomyces endophyticus]|uniref:Gfo/Idh/MocA family oxidoreductase n=1 Tax=Streptomyces endophyticus TaxID=714166 RepID=A0ABU6EYW6_9ACTN|nr:Gfo/Idh/MocA family oxidoreductase [Streptomyces endophyticus]MEB8336914.1 Gfo/Idh/MocA family oxidoreductase [Streptomyces endophyticus]
MSHATIDCGTHAPLRVLVVGAGPMGRTWLKAVSASDEADLVGLVDLDVDAARHAAAQLGRPELPTGDDLLELAARTDAQAVVNVTPPAAHHQVTTTALFAGLPVLGEKPMAATLAQALALAAAAEVSGRLFMVSQSRRWNPQLFHLRDMVAQLGAIGTLTTEFYKAPRFSGFREEMPHPLLVDMAIHAFDSARFLLATEPVSVYCEAFNPPWSWYRGDASACATFEMAGGTRYLYHGSWCAPGAETSWNGSWRASGEHGTARWDGESTPALDINGPAKPLDAHTGPSDIAGALHAFVGALRTGRTPMGEAHENAMSLAMVEAAVESARTGRRVSFAAVLEQAHAQALTDERRPQVRAALERPVGSRACAGSRDGEHSPTTGAVARGPATRDGG